jgi:hypothetical protein
MFDPQTVLQRLGGDHQLLRTIIGAYLTEAPRLLAEARDAIAKPDLRWPRSDGFRREGQNDILKGILNEQEATIHAGGCGAGECRSSRAVF